MRRFLEGIITVFLFKITVFRSIRSGMRRREQPNVDKSCAIVVNNKYFKYSCLLKVTVQGPRSKIRRPLSALQLRGEG